jgi:hypothetical protein
MRESLIFDQGALFLNDDKFLGTLWKRTKALRLERPRHGYLVECNAERGGSRIVDAQFAQCLASIRICFADRDNSEPGSAVAELTAV